MYSFIALIFFHVVTFSWPFLPGHVTMYSSTNTSMAEGVGCNVDKFTWCQALAPVNVYLYYIAYALVIGFAFPTMNITTTTLFSKVLGPRRQGTQQGIFQASGSAARMIGPILISILYSLYGPRIAWIMEVIVISTTLISWLVCYRRMVPLKVPAQLEAVDSPPSINSTTKVVPVDLLPFPLNEIKRNRSGTI